MPERPRETGPNDLEEKLKSASIKIETIWKNTSDFSEESLEQTYNEIEKVLSQGTGRDLVIACFNRELDSTTWDMVYCGLYHYKEFNLPKLPKLTDRELMYSYSPIFAHPKTNPFSES